VQRMRQPRTNCNQQDIDAMMQKVG
jgi:hypothetical protein